jgi:hypothetical protein
LNKLLDRWTCLTYFMQVICMHGGGENAVSLAVSSFRQSTLGYLPPVDTHFCRVERFGNGLERTASLPVIPRSSKHGTWYPTTAQARCPQSPLMHFSISLLYFVVLSWERAFGKLRSWLFRPLRHTSFTLLLIAICRLFHEPLWDNGNSEHRILQTKKEKRTMPPVILDKSYHIAKF